MEKAIAKMQSVQDEGKIIFFKAYRSRLEAVWQKLQLMKDIPDSYAINLTLAAGCPDLKGIVVGKPDIDKTACTITVAAPPEEVQKWRFEWLKLTVSQQLEKLGLKGPVNHAQLLSVLLRAQAGEEIKNFSISPMPAPLPAAQAQTRPFSVAANIARKEVMITINSVITLNTKPAVEHLLHVLNENVKNLSDSGGSEYRILRQEVLSALYSAITGSERVGIDLPISILGAIALKPAEPAVKAPDAPEQLVASTVAMKAPNPMAAPALEVPKMDAATAAALLADTATDLEPTSVIPVNTAPLAQAVTPAVKEVPQHIPVAAKPIAAPVPPSTPAASPVTLVTAPAQPPTSAPAPVPVSVPVTAAPAVKPVASAIPPAPIQKPASQQVKTQGTQDIPTLPADYPGKGKLTIKLSPDHMQAEISEFNMDWYSSAEFRISLDWVKFEALRSGIVFGLEERLLTAIADAIQKAENLDARIVAKGIIPTAPSEPFLHPIYKDLVPAQPKNEDDAVNLRDMQQGEIVRSGQLVAELRFKARGKPGKNVRGVSIPPLSAPMPTIHVGDGIFMQEPGKYYASADGMPVITPDSIMLSRALVHNGDVNLKSGNIRFEGPVEITGSIDSGALVEVGGDLTVRGTVRSGKVTVGGNLRVRGGIITGNSGRIRVRGDVLAEFIENSKVWCGGKVQAQKVIINSEVIAGTNIEVLYGKGMIAGGVLACHDLLKTTNLGYPEGALTELNIGTTWTLELAVRIRADRLAKLLKKLDEDKATLRELTGKSPAQMTLRHKQMKKEVVDRIQRLRPLIDKVEERVEAAKTRLVYNPEAKIVVYKKLVSNCKLLVGGVQVPIADDIEGVVVSGKMRRGSYIMSINDYREMEKKPQQIVTPPKAS